MKSVLFTTAAASALIMAQANATTSTNSANIVEDRIVVTGSPIERLESESLNGASVIAEDELQRRLASSIGETLRYEPGVTASSFGAAASRPVIRGQSGLRVRVLDNGIGSMDASAASPDHQAAVEPALAESIEIIRGPGTLRFGSAGAAGVVNVIDGRIPEAAPEDGYDGAIRFGLSSADEGEEVAAGITASLFELGDDWEVVGHLSGSWRDADDYDIPGFAESSIFRAAEEEEEHDDEHDDEDEDHHEEEEEIRDTLENSFVETQSIAAGLSLVGPRGFVGFSVRQLESEYGLPGGHGHHEEEHEEGEEEHEDEEEHHEEEEENPFTDLEQTRYDFKAAYNFPEGPFEIIRFDAAYSDYEHTEFEAPGEPGTIFSNEAYESRLELVQNEYNGWKGATGVAYFDREFSAIGEEAFVPPSETTQWGIYTFQEKRMGNLLIEGAARFENTEHTNVENNVELDFDGFSVSAGANYELSDLVSFGASVARTERAPTSEELFANGPHLATDQFEVGDVTLDTETALNIEGVFRIGSERAGVTLNVFHTDYEDYIYLQSTGEEEDELPVFEFTAEDAVFKGFEIVADAQLAEVSGFEISGDFSYDYVEAEFDIDTNDNPPLLPPSSTMVGFSAESDNLFFRGEVEYAAEKENVAPGELPTEEYTVLNAFASWTPFPTQEGFSVSLAGYNLTDEEVRLHSSPIKDVAPSYGRNIKFSARYEF